MNQKKTIMQEKISERSFINKKLRKQYIKTPISKKKKDLFEDIQC